MVEAGYTKDPRSPEGGYRLDRFGVEQRGRWRELRRALILAAAIWVAMQPLRERARGTDDGGFAFDQVVPLRLSLVLDAGLIIAYLLVGFRAWGVVRSCRPPRALRRLAWVAGCVAIPIAAALDVVEDVVLWRRTPRTGAAALEVPWLTPTVQILAIVSVAVVLLCAVVANPRLWWSRADGQIRPRWFTRFAPGMSPERESHEREVWQAAFGGPEPRTPCAQAASPCADPQEQEDERPESVICCSGGGVRSASFSLGGLQVLGEQGDRYHRAGAVVGVSGGGYVAAAFHLLRGHSDPPPAQRGPQPYAPSSPELQWLRRHTRYVLDSMRAATQAALSLGYGITINLFLLVTTLGALAWYLSWLYLVTGRLDSWQPGDSLQIGHPFGEGLGYVGAVWALPLLGVCAFVAEKVLDRFSSLEPEVRQVLRSLSATLLVVGGGLTLLVMGIPALLDALHDYALSSSSVFARLIYAVGIVDGPQCAAALRQGFDACGASAKADLGGNAGTASFTTVSTGAIVSAVLAVLGAAKGASKESAGGNSWISRAGRKVWEKVKDTVVPWTAAIGVLALALVVLLRWIAEFTRDPELLARWDLIRGFAIGLLVVRIVAEPNRTSLHHFFRERISYAFLVRRNRNRVEPISYHQPLRFSQAQPSDSGPRLVSCAVANVSDEDLVPSQRGCTPFVFDDERIGLTDRLLPTESARRPSATYEFAADQDYRDATIPAAIAMSAAAFSPLAGRESVRLGPYRMVMALGNARLGVWLPNPLWTDPVQLLRRQVRLHQQGEVPGSWRRLSCAEAEMVVGGLTARARSWLAWVLQEAGETAHQAALQGVVPRQTAAAPLAEEIEGVRSIFKKPSITRVVREAFGKASVYDRFLYVTDGGHYDNLGLIEALRRRPRRVYVLDASNDPEDTFRALGQAVATARMDLDCEIVLDPRGMRKLQEKRAAAAWCAGVATYADGTRGAIFLAKAIMLDGLSWDVETYASANLDFPRTSTSNQLYSEFDFEAYRMLGRGAMERLLESDLHRDLDRDADDDEALGRHADRIATTLDSGHRPMQAAGGE